MVHLTVCSTIFMDQSVCIRHRGSFMKTFTTLTMVFIAIVAAALTAVINVVIADYVSWDVFEELVGVKPLPGGASIAGVYLASFATLVLLMELGGAGAASFEHMKSDVIDALTWIENNRDVITAGGETKKKGLLLFGGYSSGGHVAASLMQQPNLWEERNLTEPDAVLYISGVLSTKRYDHDALLRRASSSTMSSSSLPSLSPSDDGTSRTEASWRPPFAAESSHSPLASNDSPTWLTDRVVKSVFGNEASSIPSPIHTYEKSPNIPHVFLGCYNEMFGLNLLDTYFCSASFSELLNRAGVKSRYIAVSSDHWNILNSTELSNALATEFQLIQRGSKEK